MLGPQCHLGSPAQAPPHAARDGNLGSLSRGGVGQGAKSHLHLALCPILPFQQFSSENQGEELGLCAVWESKAGKYPSFPTAGDLCTAISDPVQTPRIH